MWAGLVQRFSFNLEDYPEMLTGGFLWFKDLSLPDPYFILPILNCMTILMNMYVSKKIVLWFSQVHLYQVPMPHS